MSKRKIEYLIKTPTKEIYHHIDKPDVVFIKYKSDIFEFFCPMNELKKIRNKEIAILKDNNWPDFQIKPRSVSRIANRKFKSEYPFIEGLTLEDYWLQNEITILTCANFIKTLEEKVLAAENYIFPDIANYENIIILPSEVPMQDYKCIDSHSVLFGKYKTMQEGSSNISTSFLFEKNYVEGLKKCFKSEFQPNKQFDIRSIYAILYMIMSYYDGFYPWRYTKTIDEYNYYLKGLNIPVDSSLYKKTMLTINDEELSVPIGDSLLELADMGYQFEKNDKQYCLKKNRWYI